MNLIVFYKVHSEAFNENKRSLKIKKNILGNYKLFMNKTLFQAKTYIRQRIDQINIISAYTLN